MSDDIKVRLVSAKDATLLQDEDLPGYQKEEQGSVRISSGNLLWSYRKEHKINNIQVNPSDLDLPIDTDDLLTEAFRLHVVPRSAIFWMSPDNEESIKKYDQLLKDASDGKIIIVNEDKQYDQSKGAFMVWVRYDEAAWELHPRYDYLKKEQK